MKKLVMLLMVLLLVGCTKTKYDIEIKNTSGDIVYHETHKVTERILHTGRDSHVDVVAKNVLDSVCVYQVQLVDQNISRMVYETLEPIYVSKLLYKGMDEENN